MYAVFSIIIYSILFTTISAMLSAIICTMIYLLCGLSEVSIQRNYVQSNATG